jgi:hypothetical protein
MTFSPSKAPNGNLEFTFLLKFDVPSFTESSQCRPLTPKQTCTFQNVPHRTADIILIAGTLCLNAVLQFLQSKWTALHILFFSNSVILVPKLTHITSYSLVPRTLRTLTEHWTHTLSSYQEHYEPHQNFLTTVCSPGSLFLLNVNHASSQKNTSFVTYFCPVLIQYFSSTLFTLHNILHLFCTEFLCPQLVMLDMFGTTLCHFLYDTQSATLI